MTRYVPPAPMPWWVKLIIVLVWVAFACVLFAPCGCVIQRLVLVEYVAPTKLDPTVDSVLNDLKGKANAGIDANEELLGGHHADSGGDH